MIAPENWRRGKIWLLYRHPHRKGEALAFERPAAYCAALTPRISAVAASPLRCSPIEAANSLGVARFHLLPGRGHAGDDGRIAGNLPDVGRDALAQSFRHGRRSVKPDQAVEQQRRRTCFDDGRNIRHRLRALAVVHRQHLDAAGLRLRAHDCVSRGENLDAVLGQIVQRRHRIAIRHLRHVETIFFQPTGEHEVGRAGHGRPIEFAGLRLGLGDQLRHRIGFHGRRKYSR